MLATPGSGIVDPGGGNVHAPVYFLRRVVSETDRLGLGALRRSLRVVPIISSRMSGQQ